MIPDAFAAGGDRDNLINALAYGGMNSDGTKNPDVFYAARSNWIFVRTGADPQYDRQTEIPGAGKIVDIVMDPSNWQVAYAVDASHVWVTVDGGKKWTNITGDLALNGNNTGLSTVEIIKGASADILLVGGTRGVFRTINPVGDPKLNAPTPVNAGTTVLFPGPSNDLISRD